MKYELQEKREIQTFVVSKEIASSVAEAKKIAEDFDMKTSKVDETSSSYRFRQRDPGDFKEGSFRSFQPPGKKGVTMVFGALK